MQGAKEFKSPRFSSNIQHRRDYVVHTCTPRAICPGSQRFHLLNICRSHLHNQRTVPFALFSSLSSRPRCPDDASQKRFSWFSDWIQKVQRNSKLIDLAKSVICKNRLRYSRPRPMLLSFRTPPVPSVFEDSPVYQPAS